MVSVTTNLVILYGYGPLITHTSAGRMEKAYVNTSF